MDPKLNTQELAEHYNNLWKRTALSTFIDDLQELGLNKTIGEALQELIDDLEDDSSQVWNPMTREWEDRHKPDLREIDLSLEENAEDDV